MIIAIQLRPFQRRLPLTGCLAEGQSIKVAAFGPEVQNRMVAGSVVWSRGQFSR